MDTITITKDQFDAAVSEEIHRVISDPSNPDKSEAKLIFAMGGAAFAHGVMRRLFGENEENEK